MTDADVKFNLSDKIHLLYQLSAELAMSLDLQTTLEQVITLAVKFLDTERGSLVVLDRDGRPLDAVLFCYGRTIFNNASQFVEVVKHGLIAWVIENRKPAFINNTLIDPRWLKRADDEPDQTGAKSAMCIPLEARGELVGILTLVHPAPDYFTQEQFEFLKAVADQSGVAVHNALLYDVQESLHRQYYELFQDSITAIIITNIHGHILQANQAAIQMIAPQAEHIAGESMFELHQAPLELLGDNFEKLISGTTKVYESSLVTKENKALPIRVSVRMLPHDLDGKIQWIIDDISTEKELEAMRDDMISMVYHDIRSPLANVISSLELLKVMLPTYEDENVEEILSVISSSANRVQRLASNLLDINRLEQDQSLINLTELDMGELVQSVSFDVLPLIESRQQQLNTQIDESVETIWADEDMIKRVLINLLENASKYSPAKTPIDFLIQKTAQQGVQFTIKDQGSGVPVDQLQTIFDKFTRVDYRKGPKGIGLGLAYCKLAVEAHGGQIWAESDGESGTRFSFTLPNQSPDSPPLPFEI